MMLIEGVRFKFRSVRNVVEGDSMSDVKSGREIICHADNGSPEV